MPIDTRSRAIDTGADSIKAGVPHISWRREILAANPIDHHARDRVDAVVAAAAALRTSARDERRQSPRPGTLLSHPWEGSTLAACHRR
jgi:hypothetical protein